jgi:hypothetical protein
MSKEKCIKCRITEATIKYKKEFYCMICYMSTKSKDEDNQRARKGKDTKD